MVAAVRALVWLFLSFLALAPARAWAQAEPAPPEYVPPGKEPEPPPPSPLKWHLAVDARLAVPLGTRPPGLISVGWGAGVALSRALVELGRLRFGLGADFAYQRVQSSHHSNITLGDVEQDLSHMTFAGLLVFDGILGRVRPWLAVGGGFSVAQYNNPATDATQTDVALTTVVPLVQLATGLGVEIKHGVDLGLSGQLDFTFSGQQTGTPPLHVFSPGLFSLRLDVGFRF
jgi:hypothetical protein